jgi:hypothetical protein
MDDGGRQTMSKEKQIEEMARIMNRANGRDEDSLYFLDDAIDIYNAGYRKQSEWISVEERLPERSTRVLAYSKKYNEVNVYYYGGADEWWDNDGWASAKYYEITHWMPLPEAPKMKGGAE